MSDFQRNTTQYMESFESLFYHMWRGDNKTVIIVLPTINEAILKHFQARLPLRNNISIICPDTHELYPTNLSLAATLYFSNDALKRIK